VYVDYFIESRGGTTVLRLVHSGFGRGANWDAEYDATRARLLDGQLDGLQRGDRYSLRVPSGDVLEGTIDDSTNRGYLTAIVENWNRALMGIYCESRQGGAALLTAGFVLYGPMSQQAPAIESRWRQMLEKRFGSVN
jgi:hypothetical protein